MGSVDSWFGVLLASWMLVGFIWLCAQLIEGNWRTFQSAANEVWHNATEALEAKVLAANENGIWVEVWNRGSRGTVVKGFLVRNGSDVALIPVENAVYSQESPAVPSYNPSTGEVLWRRANPNYLLMNERKVFVLRPQSFTYIAVKGDTHKFYPIRDLEPFLITVLGVDALDSETSQPVPFSYSLTLSSTPVHLEGRAEGGKFRLRVSDEDHAYLIKLTSPGYENLVLTGGLKAGETKILQALMRYDPFDLALSESSATLTRNEGETWPEHKVTITVSPKNGYENEVRLKVEGGSVDFTLDKNVLQFSSPAKATLTLLPRSTLPDGSYTLTVKATDSSERFSRCQSYTLTLSTQRRQSSSSRQGSGGKPVNSQIWTLVNAPIDVTWKVDDYGVYPVPSSGLSDTSVTWTLKLRDGNSVSGQTNSVGFVRWTWDGYAWGWYQTATVTASKSGYGCYRSYYIGTNNILVPGDFSPTAQYSLYISEGKTELSARLYLTNIGHITGITMTSDASRLRFRKGDTVTAYFRVDGDYTRTINLSVEERHSGSPFYSYSLSATRLNGVGSFSITITCLEDPPTSVGTYIIAKGEEPIAGFTGRQMIPAEAELQIGLQRRTNY
jgi:hypothetical protein